MSDPDERGISRRRFLQQAGTAGLAAAITGGGTGSSTAAGNSSQATMAGTVPVTLKINGAIRRLDIEPRTILLDAIREPLKLPGTKKGCDHGQCGSCTVLINGRRELSCLSLAVMHEGDEITTIEGLEQDGALHPMQAAFLEHDGFQCGSCTSGQIMSAVGLLKEPVGPDDHSVRESMSGNICRCGAYQNILAAVQAARRGKA